MPPCEAPSSRRVLSLIPAALLSSALGVTAASAAALSGGGKDVDRPLTFERDIRPLFKHHCVHCHGEGEKLKGGLDVRLRRFLVEPHGAGGDVAIVAGKPAESEMLRLVREGEMPPKGKKLTPEEVLLLERWIAQGAPTARPEPSEVPKVYITEEEREFWVFQPIRKVTPPLSERAAELPNPVDRFIVRELGREKLSLNPEAPKGVLLRRVTLDLTGLPPSAEELAAFEADTAPDAYARLVDRLLASPHYGERWGRHWLDLAGYSDSDGYSEADPLRPWAFQYRDYVIRSLNADKPLDRFVQEQIAGDEMVPQPYKNLGPDAVDKLAATGFLRMVPDGTAGVAAADQVTARNSVVGETLKVVSTSLLGLSVGCAQCHDHKHDPIAQRDYYQMRAIFEPGFDTVNWRVPANRLVSLMSDKERAESDAIEAEAKVIDSRRKAREDELIELVLGWELAKRPEELRESLRTAYRTPVKDRKPEQVKLLKEHPTVNQLSAGSLYLYDTTYKTKHAEELKGIADEAAAVRKRKPPEQFVAVFNEAPVSVKTPPTTAVFHRGDPKNPKDIVGPAELTVLASFQKGGFGAASAPVDAAEPRTSLHRRLDYARHLTSGQHPLLTRVLVNRVWAHHFGRGIVGTPSDFGRMGDRPSHPELLDWLANELVEKGWSLKQLHRLLVNSSVYKQSSFRSPEKDAADPDNLLLSRMSVRRLDAEMLRDSMLVVSGLLNSKMFGPAVPVMKDVDGQVILGVDTNDGSGRPTGKFVSLEGGEFRRSVYVQMRRTRPLGMLETFDFPKMEPNCEARAASTVAPQSLALMNSEFALVQATAFADRLRAECGMDAAAMVKRAWKLAFAQDPAEDEVRRSVEFIQKQTETLKAAAAAGTKMFRPVMRQPTGPSAVKPEPTTPELAALSTFCQALMSANAFLYID